MRRHARLGPEGTLSQSRLASTYVRESPLAQCRSPLGLSGLNESKKTWPQLKQAKQAMLLHASLGDFRGLCQDGKHIGCKRSPARQTLRQYPHGSHLRPWRSTNATSLAIHQCDKNECILLGWKRSRSGYCY